MRNLFLPVLFFALMLNASVSAQPLHPPFSKPISNSMAIPDSFKCDEPEFTAPHDLFFEGRNSKDDPFRATIDPVAQMQYNEQITPFVHFENQLVRLANQYLAGNQSSGHCVLDWLVIWAKNNALLGGDNKTGRIVRQWTLASLSSAYVQIKDDKTLDLNKKALVERWLYRIANKVISNYPAQTQQIGKKNNHLYWASWSVTITGIAVDERKLFDWGMNRARYIVSHHIQGDGTLPFELKRGPKALHYHQFSVMPLVMLAETGLHNDVNLYDIRGGLLHRLIKRVLSGLDDPSYFNEKAGNIQSDTTSLNGGHLAWMEVYHARFPNQYTKKWISEFRPMFSRRIGGDMSFLYGNH